jgi:DNA (cytosine-5)-methyltransferase 1
MLTVGSVFSGIEGFGLGFERAGAKVIWNCEIDAKCRKVLRHHWPGVPRFKDVRTVTGAGLRAAGLVPDILVGGSPCQDLSHAGRRAGLNGERSVLFFEFARIAEETKPEWLVFENVSGLLNSHGGRDMGTLIGTLVDIGYMGAWRVLDAKYAGVPQRRRRVFIVGHLGDGPRAVQVLLEPEGVRRDPPPRRSTGTGDPADTGAGAEDGRGIPALSNALCANRGQRNDHNEQTFLPVFDGGFTGVRRLTPVECLRLQGFPDHWLDDLGLVDNSKYPMIGNSVCVNLIEWIARRILKSSDHPH